MFTRFNDERQVIISETVGEICYWPKVWLTSQFEELDQEILWRQDSIKIFGRKVPLPRLTAWYGDPGATYSYSGILNQPQLWTDRLKQLKIQVESIAQQPFNAMLANRYAGGHQYQGYHADDEKELGVRPVIASVSFGGTRRFVIREKHGQRRFSIDLEDGSLLVMRGALQEHFEHAIMKTQKPVAPRINLTFRRIIGVDHTS